MKTVWVITLRQYNGEGNTLKQLFTNLGIFSSKENAEKQAQEKDYYNYYRTEVLIYEVELNREVEF